jgi:hypothetical protein
LNIIDHYNTDIYSDKMLNSSHSIRRLIIIDRGVGQGAFRSMSGSKPTSSALLPPMKKPIILLDVDGVINFAGSEEKAKVLWPDIIYERRVLSSTGKRYDVLYSPAMVQKINAWHQVAEVRWLTTWNDCAKTNLAPALKLDSFENSRKSKDGKIETAILVGKEQGADGLVIWIDDDLKEWTERNDKEIASIESPISKLSPRQIFAVTHSPVIFDRPNTVLLSPSIGLTPQHVQLVDDLLRDHELSNGKVVREFEPRNRGCVVM